MRQLRTLLAALLLVAAAGRLPAQTAATNRFAGLNLAVPDGNPAGMSDTCLVTSPIVSLSAVRVRLTVAGEFNGDLFGYLRHITPQATNFVVLLNRPGRTAADPAGYDDAGLDLTFADAAEHDIHLYRNSTNLPAGQPLTGLWQPDGRTADPGAVADTSPRATSLANFNGMDANGEWTLFLADLESGGTNLLVGWELEMTGAVVPGVTWDAPANIVYGTALGADQLKASAPVPGSFDYSPPAGTVLNAGLHTLKAVFTPQNPSGYVSTTNTVTLTVTPAPLAITAVGKAKVYGAEMPELTVAFDGFVNGDTAASLDAPPQLSADATAASPAGPYSITVSGATGANYDITFVSGTLQVTPASLVITANNATAIHGEPLPVFTARYEGLVNGDTAAGLNGTLAFATVAAQGSDAGIYTVTPYGPSSPNYDILFEDGALTIQKAALTGVLSSSPNPALVGQPVAFTHNLSAVPPGAGLPTGSVQFRIDGTVAGSGTLGGGLASLATDSLVAGTHTVVAEYAGDINFSGVTNTLASDQVVHQAPVAGADTIERYPTNGVKVCIAALLANDRDPDGGPVEFVSVTATSEHGGTLLRNGKWIYYTPPPDFLLADSFTYEIRDSLGATATGTVTVAIKADNDPAMNLTATDLGNRTLRLRFDGVPLRPYSIYYTDTMSPPAWQLLTNLAASSFGIFECTNSVPEGVARFYRSSYP